MFGIGVQELIIIAIIALLIVGPKKAAQPGQNARQRIRDFKNATDGITEDLKDTFKRRR